MMNYKFFNKHNFYKQILYFYIPIKILIVISAIYVLPNFFDKYYFADNDFQNYYSKCLKNSFNYLFTETICFLNITNLSNWKAILIAFIINFIKDLLFLYVADKKLSKNYYLIFFIFIIIHPYLNIHYFKLSTIIFANLVVSLILFEIEILKKKSIFLNIFLFILSGFRNGIFFLVLLYELFNFYFILLKSKSKFLKISITIILILFILIFLNYFLRIDYLIKSINHTKSYYLNYFNIYDLLIFIPFEFLRIIFSIIFLSISHLIMLLGFREKAFTEFETYFSNINSIQFLEISVSIIFFFIHAIGIFYFFKLNNKKVYFFTFLLSLLPFLFLVSHLRYFMPYIPLALLGFCMYLEKKNLLNKFYQ